MVLNKWRSVDNPIFSWYARKFQTSGKGFLFQHTEFLGPWIFEAVAWACTSIKRISNRSIAIEWGYLNDRGVVLITNRSPVYIKYFILSLNLYRKIRKDYSSSEKGNKADEGTKAEVKVWSCRELENVQKHKWINAGVTNEREPNLTVGHERSIEYLIISIRDWNKDLFNLTISNLHSKRFCLKSQVFLRCKNCD
jgi:hypothetical protein